MTDTMAGEERQTSPSPEVTPNPSTAPEPIAIVEEAAALSDLEYDTRRKELAQRAGIRTATLDKARREAILARNTAEAADSAPDANAAEAPAELPEDLDAKIAALAVLSRPEFASRRAAAAERLGMRGPDLDKAVNGHRARERAEREAESRAAPAPAAGTVIWPAWIKHRPDGLYADAGEDAPPVWLTGPFDVAGECRGRDGNGWGLWLRWRDRENRLKTWAMPSRLVMVTTGELESELVQRGLRVSADPAARLRLRRALAEVRAGTLVMQVHRAGWHATPCAPAAYMKADGEAIGETGETLVYEPGEEGALRCATAGTLKGWQNEIAALAVGNPLAAFCIAGAFAGPLLQPCEEKSGGFHVTGGSKGGKTSAFQMAATVWGPPQKGAVLRDWNSTGNALEVAAEEAGDGLMLLDEVHQADPRIVTSAIYDLAGEGGKARLTREAKGRQRRTWRTFILSNGEIALATVAEKAGQRLPAGAAVRLPSIPVEKGGRAWPALHGTADYSELMSKLHSAMVRHHGHAASAFIEKLTQAMATGEDVRGFLAERREHFAGCLSPDADVQTRDVARRFALVAAAGELAAAFGILPWLEGEASNTVEAIMAAWLAQRGGGGAAEDFEAVVRVRAFIAAHGDSRFPGVVVGADGSGTLVLADTVRVVNNRAGFRKKVSGEAAYLFFPDTWKDEVFAGADSVAGAKALDQAGFLLRGGNNKLARRDRVPGFEGPVRFYGVRASIVEGVDGAA